MPAYTKMERAIFVASEGHGYIGTLTLIGRYYVDSYPVLERRRPDRFIVWADDMRLYCEIQFLEVQYAWI